MTIATRQAASEGKRSGDDVCYGSFRDIGLCGRNVAFAPNNGRHRLDQRCQLTMAAVAFYYASKIKRLAIPLRSAQPSGAW
jgi:hypothetical protein